MGVLVSEAGINLTMKVFGLTEAGLKAEQAKRIVAETKPLMNKAIIILEQSQLKTFRMEGRPTWKKSGRAKAQNGKTLRDTTRLQNSVSATSSEGAVRKIDRNKLTFGTKIIYAPTHQYGMRSLGIPKRPFLGVFDEDIKMMEQVFKDDIEIRLVGAMQ